MSSRLAQMTDESLGHGVPGAAKAIEEAGFSEELKRQLEERIKESTFRSENPAAFAQINMPVGLWTLIYTGLTYNNVVQRGCRHSYHCGGPAMDR